MLSGEKNYSHDNALSISGPDIDNADLESDENSIWVCGDVDSKNGIRYSNYVCFGLFD